MNDDTPGQAGGDLQHTLDQILRQTRLTNGRVLRLEEEVFGLPERQTDGLIKQVAVNTAFREKQETVAKLVKYVVTPSTLATLAAVLKSVL